MTEYRPYSQIDLSYVSCSDCVGCHEYTYSRCLGTEPPDHPVSAQQMIGYQRVMKDFFPCDLMMVFACARIELSRFDIKTYYL